MKLYQRLARLVDTIKRLQAADTVSEWEDRHTDTLEGLVKQYMPSGSGFDAGTKLDLERSTKDKLVFTTEYHHLNDSGFYVGWSTHDVLIRANLCYGMDIRVTGRDREGIKEYVHETFGYILNKEVTERG